MPAHPWKSGASAPRKAPESSGASAPALGTRDSRLALPSLKRVLLLQLLHRLPHNRFESLRLSDQPRSRLRPLALHPYQPISRYQPPRDFQQMPWRSLQILRIGRIPYPDPLLYRHGIGPGCPVSRVFCEKRESQLRLPINLPLEKSSDHIIAGLAKYPLLPLDVVMPARKRHRLQLPPLQQLN